MAVSLKPATGTTVTVAAGVPVQPPVLLPDNTNTLIVYNPNAGLVYLGWAQTAGAFLADVGAGNVIVVPSGSAITLAINSLSGRAFTPNDNLWLDISAGGGPVYLTYVNGISL